MVACGFLFIAVLGWPCQLTMGFIQDAGRPIFELGLGWAVMDQSSVDGIITHISRSKLKCK